MHGIDGGKNMGVNRIITTYPTRSELILNANDIVVQFHRLYVILCVGRRPRRFTRGQGIDRGGLIVAIHAHIALLLYCLRQLQTMLSLWVPHGGAGGDGQTGYSPNRAGKGGDGAIYTIAGPVTRPAGGVGVPGFVSGTPNASMFAGGGGGRSAGTGGAGGGNPTTNLPAAGGGSGDGSPGGRPGSGGQDGLAGTGGGGGGSGNSETGYQGGSGIVVIRYEIPSGTVTGAKATGGMIAYRDGKVIHTFLSPATFQTSSAIPSAKYLIVAGGGAGGDAKGYFSTHGGGGGAGGLRTNVPTHPFSTHGVTMPFSAPSPYAVTVGAGGEIFAGSVSTAGADSSLAYNGGTVTARGGGVGGGAPSNQTPTSFNGGSGGGGGGDDPSGGQGNRQVATTTSTGTQEGNDAGNRGSSPGYAGGGGGGAGGSGSTGGSNPSTGGDGGAGTTVTIGSETYAICGGGGGAGGVAHGSGGSGGGGNGAPTDTNLGIPGGTGTGGGGGAANVQDNSSAGSGGPGVVIIEYDA